MNNIAVLFVDDDELLLHSLKRAMLYEPYQSLFASSGKEALQILKNQNKIQTIVSDLCMPEMDGLTLLNEVKSTYPHIKLIALSGHPIVTQGTSQNKLASRTITFDIDHEIHMLSKPWETSELQELIREMIYE